MSNNYEVVIAGGGVMGCAVAYFLAADPGFVGRILVLERDPTYEFASTTLSWGGIRQQFSTPENIRMAAFNIPFLKSAHETLAVAGEGPALSLREQGYLFLASARGEASLRDVHAIQKSEGATVEMLDPGQLASRFPWLNLDGIAAGSFGYENEGWLDPYALLQGFRSKARSLGVEFRIAEVAALERQGKAVVGVSLTDGETIAAGWVVNAAGWRAGALAATADIQLPVEARKRMTYVFDCREDLSSMPLTIDPTGVGTRPEGQQHMGLVSPPEAEDGPGTDFELEYDLFENVIWPTLANRIPAFEAIKLSRAWAGMYDYNTFDQNAILGPHPEIDRILFCNGFSGHGIQQSPAAGRAVAEWLIHGTSRSLDLSAFGYERIAENRPIYEAAVV
ncbi:MAG: FAD-binding oxidoreductase [Rhodospirillaceae bacterium]|jgi:FAD-dependent oxidoreductase domain-containing protein 1|nr:FAD-binding oxidoreductase [Rhodospirillaceae bacterium]MBT4045083.1 FAD-binding oxidoreductase [Rhodospirillaceae bacterium]MBT4686555.1 FAD-binding oxidoreductase [Rhodospirillaceae bacterium]MBT5082697.1 FAD-binding oxidoreductase [Rhodospirillaceae bacterium]MBT5524139.1 FAD-binding oxidoreductase [Rhodospirillaceae bacterium]